MESVKVICKAEKNKHAMPKHYKTLYPLACKVRMDYLAYRDYQLAQVNKDEAKIKEYEERKVSEAPVEDSHNSVFGSRNNVNGAVFSSFDDDLRHTSHLPTT